MDTETASESEKDKGRRPFFEASRRIMMAGIGAMALAQDEMEDFVDKLIERGEIAEKDGKKLVQELRERRKKRAEKVEEEMAKHVRAIMDRMDVPTKADFDKLSQSIAALAQKIDELSKSRK